MTGGIEETYELSEINKYTFFEKLGNALAHDAMMVRCQMNRENKLFKYLI